MKKNKRLNQILKQFVGQIVTVKGKETLKKEVILPQWQIKREKYLYKGHIKDENLRSVLANEIVIEFDHLKGADFDCTREEAIKWIENIRKLLVEWNIYFVITDHKGKSPHIRLYVCDLETVKDVNLRNTYKLSFAEDLLKEIHFCSKHLSLDSGLITSKNKLVPIAEQPHWKEKYNGAREEIIFENDAPLMQLNKHKLEELHKEKLEKNFIPQNEEDIALEDVKVEFLKQFWKTYYKEGMRNTITLAFGGICLRKGIKHADSENLLKLLLKAIGAKNEDVEERLATLRHTYNLSKKEVAVYTHFRNYYNDEAKARKVNNLLIKCFEKPKTDISLSLNEYFENNKYNIELNCEVKLVVLQKHIEFRKEEGKKITRIDTKKKITQKNISEIAKLAWNLNLNPTYEYVNDEGKIIKKESTQKEINKHLINTSLFEDLQNLKQQKEEALQTQTTKIIESKTVESTLDNIKGFRSKTQFVCKGLLREIIETKEINGAVKNKCIGKIFEILPGHGNLTNLLITTPEKNIETGVTENYIGYYAKKELSLFLKSCDEEDIKAIAKKIGINTKEGEEPVGDKKLKKTILEKQKNKKCLLTIIPPVAIEELRKYGDISSIINKAITGGLNKSPLLVRAYLATFGKIESLNHNHHLMKFQPHGILITGTKTGKSTTTNRIGKNHDKIKLAGALGFATADKKEQGAFHNATNVQGIDELKDVQDSNICQRFLDYMENGKFTNTSGIRSECIGCHPIFFQSNPKGLGDLTPDSEYFDNYDKNRKSAFNFIEIISKVTDNFLAMGSRLGIILYRPEIAGCTGTPLKQSDDEKVLSLYHFIQDCASSDYTNIFEDETIRNWLWEEYGEKQRQILDALIRKTDVSDLKDFIRGHKESYRHVKGAGLNLAFVQQLPTVILGKDINYEILLDDAKDYFRQVFDENIQSLQLLVSNLDKNVYSELLSSNYEDISGKKKVLLELAGLALLEIQNLEKRSDKIFVKKMIEKLPFLVKKQSKSEEKTRKFYANLRPHHIQEIFDKKWQNYLDVLLEFDLSFFSVDKIQYLRIVGNKTKFLMKKTRESYGTDESSSSVGVVEKESKKSNPKASKTPITPKPDILSQLVKYIEEKDTGEGINKAEFVSLYFGQEEYIKSLIVNALERGLILENPSGILRKKQ
jgi:hypothetical protein